MKDKINVIIPFCIYHYIDPSTQTYYGYIGNPRKTRLDDGSEVYQCPPEPRTFKRWFLAGTFYAVSPSFRPIPVGMRIFCAKRIKKFPYATNDVDAMYDPYNIKDDCVYFTTYNQPVPNTEPLYFHISGDLVFPSFDPRPPSDDPTWEQTNISPIFVMTPKSVGDIFANESSGVKFKCVNGRCLPWVHDIPDMWDSEPLPDLLDLDECVLYCNKTVLSENMGRPFNLLEMVVSGSKTKPVISRFIKKLHPWVTGLVITIFIVLLFMILYTLIKKKKENENRRRY